jgi:hypothetical protein
MRVKDMVNRLFSNMTPKSEESISKSQRKRTEVNWKLDRLIATLNGEEEWFLCAKKKKEEEGGNDGKLPAR